MAINEVFKNSTVQQVIFQIIFPNYFSIENKIGDYQLSILEKFPKSSLLLQNQILIGQSITGNVNSIDDKQLPASKKIWQFKSQAEDITLNITTGSLDISSTKHKTYNNETSDTKFREIVTFCVQKFLEIIPLIRISQMGLRYIDDCPLPNELTTENFLSYYNSHINFSSITNIQDVDVIELVSAIRTSGIIVRFRETLQKTNEKFGYSLDFDGQILNIPISEYLIELDKIHNEIAKWYEDVIREPVINIMKS